MQRLLSKLALASAQVQRKRDDFYLFSGQDVRTLLHLTESTFSEWLP